MPFSGRYNLVGRYFLKIKKERQNVAFKEYDPKNAFFGEYD
jgi:hypothetical protein